MDRSRAWSNRVVGVSSLFAGFGVAHLIDDFLYGVPAEFNLPVVAARVMGGVFFVALTALIALAARGSRRSYAGPAIIGGLLALAGTLRPVPEMAGASVCRSGFLSAAFAVGLIASGLATMPVSLRAWHVTGKSEERVVDP
jgi:hypothetical protein